MKTTGDCTCTVLLLLSIAAALLGHSYARKHPKGPITIGTANDEASLTAVEPATSSSSYLSSPFTLPPYDSLPPYSLPPDSPPHCICTPSTSLPPTVGAPTPSLGTPPGPYGTLTSPPPSPIGTTPTPPAPITTPSPPRTYEPSPTTSPSPPFVIPMPPESIPRPPYYYKPSPPYHFPSPSTGFGPSPPTGHAPSPPTGFEPSPPVFLPPVVFPPPAAPPPPPHGEAEGTLWCVAKPSVPDPMIQEAMNYACGSGADCSLIQPDGACYQPNTLIAHASYAFNSYWQRTKVAGGTCDFGGTAMVVTVDPSYDGCHFISSMP